MNSPVAASLQRRAWLRHAEAATTAHVRSRGHQAIRRQLHSQAPRELQSCPRPRILESQASRQAPVCRSAIALSDTQSGDNPAAYDQEIWGVALPALASMLLEPIIGVINTGMIGRLGTLELGAVSLASIVVSFAGFLFSFLLFLTTPEIASAVVRKDLDEVSRISSKSIWVAVGFSVVSIFLLITFAQPIIRVMAPPEPLAAQYAVEYVATRAWGILPVLVGYVATGTYRGLKDTRTPLYGAVGSATCSLVLTWLFLSVFGWGVKGGALAVVISQSVSTSVLCYLLLQKGMIQVKDLMKPPPLDAVLPMLRKGLVLGLRNIISLGMVMYASALCVRAGSSYQASFEVIRQVWMLTITFFECLNVAAQTLCAAYLGAGNRHAAMKVLSRILQLGCLVGAVVGVIVFAVQDPFVRFFTTDPLVISQALLTMPMVCVLFPLDAAASIMDGSLLAARQTDYMSAVHICGSFAQLAVLVYLSSNNLISCLTIWSVLKVLSVIRAGGGIVRNWFSPHSAYRTLPPSTAAAPVSEPASAPVASSFTAAATLASAAATVSPATSSSEVSAVSSSSSHVDVHSERPSSSVAMSVSPSVTSFSDGGVMECDVESLAPETLTATVCAVAAAHDSELVEKGLQCHQQQRRRAAPGPQLASEGVISQQGGCDCPSVPSASGDGSLEIICKQQTNGVSSTHQGGVGELAVNGTAGQSSKGADAESSVPALQ